MAAQILVVGRASTISAQLAAIQRQGLVPSGPKIITNEGGPKSQQRTDAISLHGRRLSQTQPAANSGEWT